MAATCAKATTTRRTTPISSQRPTSTGRVRPGTSAAGPTRREKAVPLSLASPEPLTSRSVQLRTDFHLLLLLFLRLLDFSLLCIVSFGHRFNETLM